MTRVAIYCRISRDRVGAGLGVERQEKDCRELARKNKWKIVSVHVDNDISAYSGKPRPGYLRLLEQVRVGEVDAVACWHTDRLHRNPVELESWIDAAQVHGVAVHTVKAGPLDLATPAGRMVARQLGAVARYEVEHRSERVRAAKLDAASRGSWRGGRRPFGYDGDGVTVREDEAKIVDEMSARALAGESLHSLARELNTKGVLTSAGGAWKPPELRSLLLRARNAGLIEHEREIVGEAEWAAIVDRETWEAVRRLLTSPGRRSGGYVERVWLGSGLFRCGVCNDGATMISATSNTKKQGGGFAPSYSCVNGKHISRAAQILDDMVSDLVIERLSRKDARLLLAPKAKKADVTKLLARREGVTSKLNELAGLFADGAITGAQLAEATRKLRVEGEGIDAQLAASAGSSALAGIADAKDKRAAWENASLSRRKAVVAELFTVTIMPAPKGRPPGWKAGESYFHPASVKIDWREDLAA